MVDSSAVSLQDVSVRFGRRWSLIRLNLDLPAGDPILLTGDNGAGKTTLLRVMATAIRPTRGKVHLGGVEAWRALEAVRPKVGLVTHANHLYDQLSARENLELCARLTGCAPDPIDELLERVKLSADAHRPVGQYSAGMKRRVGIARLLLRKPNLCLLDEPFGQLDPAGVEAMEDIVRELCEAGRTVVIATHDHPRGRALCRWHLQLSGGRQQGKLEELAA